MNRARGGRVLESGRTLRFIRVNVVFYQSFPSVGAFGAFLALSFRVLNDCRRVLARCIASTLVFTLMARAERRRFFIRLAWHCDDNDCINTSGDTTPRLTLRAGAAAYAMLARLSTRTTKAKRTRSRLVRIMFPTKLSRRFAPAASVQSSYLTLSGCHLLSQG